MKRKSMQTLRNPVHSKLKSTITKKLVEDLRLGLGLHNQGRINEAANIYKRILSDYPKCFDALHLLGLAFCQKENYTKALDLFERAILIKKNNAVIYNNRGVALKELKRYNEALSSYDKATELKPDYAEAYSNRGVILRELKLLNEAITSYDRAIELKPNYAEAYSNRGDVLQDLKRFNEAVSNYDRAVFLKPDYADAYNNRGNALRDLKRLEEALSSYKKAIALKPDNDFWIGTAFHTQMHLCDWTDFDNKTEIISTQIEHRRKVSVPFPLIALLDNPSSHKVASQIFVKTEFPPSPSKKNFVIPKDVQKIKVGYFSSDFYDHATMHLMGELFEQHNKSRFEFIAFSFGPTRNDQWQNRAKAAFDKFIDCQDRSDAEISKISKNLGVHIAVDLKGFTENSRTGIFSHRAAPIQVNFIGYPGTMSADYIDYIIADELLIPEHLRKYYAEKVAYLPYCYQPNCRTRDISNKTITRSDFDLPEDGFVFSSFNNNYKITPEIFATWIRILKQVDGSVLWLMSSNTLAENNLRSYIEENGVDSARLVFAKKLPIEEHLNRIRLADLMLDTFPYGAHTTCSDALRMNLPVLTLMGESFASRVAASLLTTVGLPQLITESLSHYESLAIELARTPEKLSAIRARLQRNIKSTPLFNPELFAKNLESLYEIMYRRCSDGLPVDHIRIPSVAI